MTVAIVTVCRNAAATIGRCLDSVAAQSVPGLVHVVQDGASTDATAALLAAHATRVDLRLVSEPDRGQNDALLRALRRCDGAELIGFVWADEVLTPGAVERACAAVADDPRLVAVYGDVVDTDPDGTPRSARVVRDWSCDAVARYEDIPPVCGAFVRPTVVKTLLRIATHAPECTEWLLWLAAASTGPVRRLAAVQAGYACHDEQLSRRPEMVDDYARCIADAAYALARDPSMPAALRETPATAAAHAHLQAGEWRALVHGDDAAALRHLDAALAHMPGARLVPLHLWTWGKRWIATGRAASLNTALTRACAAGVHLPAGAFLAAAAHLAVGDDAAAATAMHRLEDEPGAPREAVGLAAIVRCLDAAGHPDRAERLLAMLVRLGRRAPAWRFTLVMVLTNLDRPAEALALASEIGAEGDELRLGLELLVVARDPGLRTSLGRLGGRAVSATAEEANAVAVALARLLGRRSAPSPALLEALLVFHAHARCRGLTAVDAAVNALLGASSPESGA